MTDFADIIGTGLAAVDIGAMVDPTTSKGDLIVRGSATTRLPVGADGQVLTTDSTQPSGLKWASGAPLAVVSYNPAIVTTTSTSAATFSDVDATNLAITFTAPASGKVLVMLNAVCYVSAEGQPTQWNLREGTTNLKAMSMNGNPSLARVTAWFYITGLTAGTSHTYKWGFACPGGGPTTNIRYGDDGTTIVAGAAVMIVWPA